jgi:hypothetical protein
VDGGWGKVLPILLRDSTRVKPEMIVLLLPLTIGVGALVLRAREAETRSKKLGVMATACGVGGFIPALLGPTFKEADRPDALASCGVFTLLFAIAAVILALRTFSLRQRDHGIGRDYPVAALLCGGANLLCGSGLLISASRLPPAALPTNQTTWTWRSEKHGFELTIPSDEWKLVSNPNLVAEFRYPELRIIGAVGVGLPGKPNASHEEVLAYGRMVRDDTPTSNTVERTEANRHGHPHWVYMGDAKIENKPYFFGISVTRVGGTPVLLMLEGQYRRSTEDGRAEEARVIRAQAEVFLSSVK